MELREKQLTAKVLRDVNNANRYQHHNQTSNSGTTPTIAAPTAKIVQNTPVSTHQPKPVQQIPSDEGFAQFIEQQRQQTYTQSQKDPKMLISSDNIAQYSPHSKDQQDYENDGNKAYYASNSRQNSNVDNVQQHLSQSNFSGQSYPPASQHQVASPRPVQHPGNISGRGRFVTPAINPRVYRPAGRGGQQRFPAPRMVAIQPLFPEEQQGSQITSSGVSPNSNQFSYSNSGEVSANYSSLSNTGQSNAQGMSQARFRVPSPVRSRNPLAKNATMPASRGGTAMARMPTQQQRFQHQVSLPNPVRLMTPPMMCGANSQAQPGYGFKNNSSFADKLNNKNVSNRFAEDVNLESWDDSSNLSQSFESSVENVQTSKSNEFQNQNSIVSPRNSTEAPVTETENLISPTSYKVVRSVNNSNRGYAASMRGGRGGGNLPLGNQNLSNAGANQSMKGLGMQGNMHGQGNDAGKGNGHDKNQKVPKSADNQAAGTPDEAPTLSGGTKGSADLDLDVIKAALKSLVPADEEEDDDIERHVSYVSTVEKLSLSIYK